MMLAETSYKGKLYPLCGHNFWDNNEGVTTACKLLGFETGKLIKPWKK